MPDDPSTAAALAYARANMARFQRELVSLVAIPSVSGDAARGADVRRCAEYLASGLKVAGMPNTRMIDRGGAPIVAAECRVGRRTAPSLLVYGHYDVVPSGPESEWRSPPFRPAIRDGAIVGRGASDDKGQLFAHVKALESWLRGAGTLPLNVLCLFEGEEEIGSPSLRRLLATERHRLRADAAIISDTRMRGPNHPAITYGLRGKLALEIIARRAGREVHAGEFGGAVPDPAAALCLAVASLHDARERVAVAGFHDDVRGASTREREYMAHTGPSDGEISGMARHRPSGDASLYERTTILPALSVTQLRAGDVDGHGKSAIATHASALLDARLVPDQKPEHVVRCIRDHVQAVRAPGVHLSVRVHSASPPLLVDPVHPAIRAAARAVRSTFGVPPVLLRSGGTIPIAGTFAAAGVFPVLLGFGLSSDGMHAANEHFALERYARAIECSIRFIAEAARMLARTRLPGRAVGPSRTAHSTRVPT